MPAGALCPRASPGRQRRVGSSSTTSGSWKAISTKGSLKFGNDGDDAEGRPIPCSAEAEVSEDKPNWYRWRRGATRRRLERTYIHWFAHDLGWQDVTGQRSPDDVERPVGEWNRCSIEADGDHLRFMLNGVVVNEAFAAVPREGRILFQTEGAEIFFRNLVLRPIEASAEPVSR